MGTATLVARVLLAVVFGAAAFTKVIGQAALRGTLQEFGVQRRLGRVAAIVLPIAELAVTAALLFVATARVGAIGASLLLLVFIAGITNALRQGRTPDCGCFGQLRSTPIGPATLVRNLGLLGLSVFAAVAGAGLNGDRLTTGALANELLVIATVLTLAGATVLVSRRLPAAKQPELSRSAPGRPELGTPAPEFHLDGACGPARSLTSLYASGRPLVLVFGDSNCGGCRALFPHLSRWQQTLVDRLQIAVVGLGAREAAQLICREYGVESVLLDSDGAVWRAYGIHGGPAAVAVAPDGTLVGGPAVGQDAIEDLIRLTLHRPEPMPETWNTTTSAA